MLEATTMTRSDAVERCPVCGGAVVARRDPYRNWWWHRVSIFQSLELAHCGDCGFGFALPEPSSEDISRFYRSVYRAKPSILYVDFSRPSFHSLDYRSVAQISLASAFCNFADGDVFLDIGPGAGDSFQAARTLLPNPKLVGIELAAGAKHYYRKFFGADAYDSLTQFVASGQRAKILLMSQSLEHYRLGDLDYLFQELSAALADDGALLIEVPHVDLRKNGELRGNDSPHLLFFGEASLRTLLETKGFAVPFIRAASIRLPSRPPRQEDVVAESGRIARAVNALPPALVRLLVRLYHAFFPAGMLGRFETFLYGDDRDCLRAVARKTISGAHGGFG